MPSVTLHCHPAALYYWLEAEIIGKVEGLRYKEWAVTPENEFAIIGDLVQELPFTYRQGGVSQRREDYLTDITLHSDDEDLLVWVSLAGPNRNTPLHA